MDRMTFLSKPKIIKATGSHMVSRVYDDDQIRAVADAGRLSGLDEVMFGRLRTRLDAAAMWFRISRHGRSLVPTAGTIKTLEQIGKRAEKVIRHVDLLIAQTKGPHGRKIADAQIKQISPRALERFRAARSSLNAVLGSNNRGIAGLSRAAGLDLGGADTEDPEEKRMAFLDGPVGRALNTSGSTNETPLEAILDRLADPGCAVDVIRDLSEELAARAKVGAERLKDMRSSMVRPGNSGDYAMNGWLDDVLNIYEQFSGKKASITVSVKPETFGLPEGPAIGFVMAAFEPIRRDIIRRNDRARKDKQPLPFGEFYELQGSDAWSTRIRTALEHRANAASENHTTR